WQVRLAGGSLGGPGAPTNARSFYSGTDVSAVDYSPALRFADPLAAPVPFQPSYEDRSTGPDRVFAAVDDAAYERLVAAWAEALARAGAGQADLLHLHHLTPAHEAARRAFPALPIVGQLHGTELAFLRTLAAGPRSGWWHARVWEQRLHRWAGACARPIVRPGSEAEVAALPPSSGCRSLSAPTPARRPVSSALARSFSSGATRGSGRASIRSRRSDRSAPNRSSSPAGARTNSCPRRSTPQTCSSCHRSPRRSGSPSWKRWPAVCP